MTRWEEALNVTAWNRPGVWVHGDVAAGNILFRGGRLTAVIDWGCLGVGDPACDLIIAWEIFDADSRAVLRSELGVDDATWERGRGWALSTAIAELSYYQDTNQFMADRARRQLTAVLADECSSTTPFPTAGTCLTQLAFSGPHRNLPPLISPDKPG